MVDVDARLAEIHSTDKGVQGRAFETLMEATDTPVDWSYEVWDELVADLAHSNNRVRAIAAQVLCNLARSDPEHRILDTLPELMAVTRDERFVTARHCLQSLWKVGVIGATQREAYRQALAARFAAAADEKNGSLVRADIIESLRRVHDATGAQSIHETAEQLIATEADEKYRRKYAKLWRTGAAR